MSKLTEKQKAFADYYIESLNAVESYMRAYDTGNYKVAGVEGSRNLEKPKIKEYINERLQKASNDRIATIQEIMEFHTKVMNNKYKELGYNKPLYIKDRQVSAEALTKRLELMEAKEGKGQNIEESIATALKEALEDI